MTSSEQSPAAQKPLRIGIVGVGAGPSWSKISHIPAIQALSGVELTAVAASGAESARAAGEALGISETYASVPELAASAKVDLVTIRVKVPAHREMVLAVLHAGKHVLCEWPLGLNVRMRRCWQPQRSRLAFTRQSACRRAPMWRLGRHGER